MLAHEGVSESEGVHGLGPIHCAQTGRKFPARPEVPGFGSSGQVPDGFRAIQRVGALGAGLDSGAGGSGKVGRSGGRKFRAEAGSFGLSRSLSLLLLPSPLPCLALVLGSSMVVSVVPEYMQGPCMR
mgnify:CR=1 FL=1